MALKKRSNSIKVQNAEKRLNAMSELDRKHEKAINYGGENNPLRTTEMRSQIDECRMLINEYNNILEMADKKSGEIRLSEEKLGDLFTRVLAGAKGIFGIDSDEVEALGGTKKSERKRHGFQ